MVDHYHICYQRHALNRNSPTNLGRSGSTLQSLCLFSVTSFLWFFNGAERSAFNEALSDSPNLALLSSNTDSDIIRPLWFMSPIVQWAQSFEKNKSQVDCYTKSYLFARTFRNNNSKHCNPADEKYWNNHCHELLHAFSLNIKCYHLLC